MDQILVWSTTAMSQSNGVDLLALPDEMLLTVLSKLKPADVLFSLLGVNNRLDRIACGHHFTTQEIDLTASSMLDRFCSYILPRIGHDITWLTVDSANMKRVLLASDYPNLTTLSLIPLSHKTVIRHFIDNSPCVRLLKHQISHLIVKLNDGLWTKLNTDVFKRILVTCTSLIKLKVMSKSTLRLHVLTSNSLCWPTLLELDVDVDHFYDCLFLLEGYLPQLQILRIKIRDIRSSQPRVTARVFIPPLKLRKFSLICYSTTTVERYNEWILPLLRRMTNLEQLTLWLVLQGPSVITGVHLDEQILAYMPRLHTFNFNIHTSAFETSPKRPNKADIERTFPIRLITPGQVICHVKYSLTGCVSGHIVSLPYTFDRLGSVSYDSFESFSGPHFMNIRSLLLCEHGHRPFDNAFYDRVSRSFPFLENLCILGTIPPMNNNQLLSPVVFPHLTTLVLFDCVHVDYVKQFLIEPNIQLPRLDELQIKYDDLMTLSNNFTRKTTLSNCATVTRLHMDKGFPMFCSLSLYFPSLRHTYERSRNLLW